MLVNACFPPEVFSSSSSPLRKCVSAGGGAAPGSAGVWRLHVHEVRLLAPLSPPPSRQGQELPTQTASSRPHKDNNYTHSHNIPRPHKDNQNLHTPHRPLHTSIRPTHTQHPPSPLGQSQPIHTTSPCPHTDNNYTHTTSPASPYGQELPTYTHHIPRPRENPLLNLHTSDVRVNLRLFVSLTCDSS